MHVANGKVFNVKYIKISTFCAIIMATTMNCSKEQDEKEKEQKPKIVCSQKKSDSTKSSKKLENKPIFTKSLRIIKTGAVIIIAIILCAYIITTIKNDFFPSENQIQSQAARTAMINDEWNTWQEIELLKKGDATCQEKAQELITKLLSKPYIKNSNAEVGFFESSQDHDLEKINKLVQMSEYFLKK